MISLTLLAALAVAAAPAAAPPADAPVTLSIETGDAGVVVRVVGRSARPVAGRYTLNLTSGGNRTVQRGTMRLRPGETTVLLTARVASPETRHWTARLQVAVEGQDAYEVVKEG